jgi:hypothetical protein
MTRFTLAGNELTETGFTVQLFAPYVVTQLKATGLLKPSCEAIAIGPLVPVLPTFTFGKVFGSLKIKLGLVVTVITNDVVAGAGAPEVSASSVTV